MEFLETIIVWVIIFGYAGVFAVHLFGFIDRRERLEAAGIPALWAVFVLHTALGIMHWIAGGHPPVTNTFENNLTGTWFTLLLFLIFERLGKLPKTLSLVVVPIAFLVFGYGFMKGITISPMGPAFQSPWLVVHVVFAWLAFGSYSIATGASVFFLLKMRRPDSARLNKLPKLEDLDAKSYRYVAFGFINHAVMLASGALWAKKLWGQYWNWDPLETWTLIAFLFYAFILHARSFWKWKMKRAAIATVFGLLFMFIAYWGSKLLAPDTGIHPTL